MGNKNKKENGDTKPPPYAASQSNPSLHTDVEKEFKVEEEIERGEWTNKAEFLLSCIGLSVGLGNVWRFSYLAYENGGAAFVIAYIILQILIGKPMYMMELIVSQYCGRGPTGIWAMNPCAKGIGISMGVISLVASTYYNVIVSYTLYYLFASMQKVLPWTTCRDEWLDYGCVEKTTRKLETCTGNATLDMVDKCLCHTTNYTFNEGLTVNCTNTTNTAVAELYFYKMFALHFTIYKRLYHVLTSSSKTVIQKAPNMYPSDMAAPIWQLALCLLLGWIIVVVCLIKGIKSSGKVVYFTATFPYVILIILLVRGCLLDGAIDGVKYFIVPEWSKLATLDVWAAAAGQMFFSLSVAFGGILMFGSYNKFKNNVYGDALIISSMDLITSIIAGFVVFTNLGGMAKAIGVSVQDVAKGGYGLAFVAYPEALSKLPPNQLWSILFFFMLFTLGLDSQFGFLETTLVCIQDEFPQLRKYKTHMCIGFGVALYLIALPCITNGGDYVVTLLDFFGADFSVLFIAVCESIAIMWVYGVKRFMKDCEYMLGHAPRPMYFWAFCWSVCAPFLTGALFLYRMIKFKSPEITKGVPYPLFARGIGFALTALVLIPIPLTFLYTFFTAKGTVFERLRTITTPDDTWGPNDGSMKHRLVNTVEMVAKHGIDNPEVVAKGDVYTHL
ncbi:sodium- and chloride-dependent neutral and basic amino acid transporter B(0+)-like [Dreissena polymorpha]|uniref:sodium- and chloride-dependent neutral and basic amino acid transporter B(0+)-like n=1 Tax=Dreissena polymorpha TaxID=45954 RepID=UPI002264EE81|nr:sodium- and chloride-dependent neutral and basic amino acid transporter B(0+)-like [Dreissena polymorpha]